MNLQYFGKPINLVECRALKPAFKRGYICAARCDAELFLWHTPGSPHIGQSQNSRFKVRDFWLLFAIGTQSETRLRSRSGSMILTCIEQVAGLIEMSDQNQIDHESLFFVLPTVCRNIA